MYQHIPMAAKEKENYTTLLFLLQVYMAYYLVVYCMHVH